jgi:protein-L-isoaspartate O-methyltransferase
MVVWEDMWKRDGGLKPGQYFDASGSSKVLLQLLKHNPAPASGASALVPGCGRGYDVIEMAKVGYHALGLDIAPTAVAAAQAHNGACLKTAGLGAWPGSASFSTDDFFQIQPPAGGFDLIYDYTFLCALDPAQRVQWAETMRRLIKPKTGELVTLIFPLGEYEGGPPHAMSKQLVSGLIFLTP